MSPAFQELLIEHALWALQKQKRFVSWLGRHEWQWQGQSGTLLLRRLSESASEEIHSFQTQALGSFSQMSETWTWIWANDLAELDTSLMHAALRLRALGEERDVPELVTGEFSSTSIDAHRLALVAAELLNGEAYYRGTYLGGAGFVLIENGLSGVLPSTESLAQETLEIVQEVGDIVPSNHRAAIEAYLHRARWHMEEGQTMKAHRGDETIELIFEDNNLMSAREY